MSDIICIEKLLFCSDQQRGITLHPTASMVVNGLHLVPTRACIKKTSLKKWVSGEK